MCSLIARAVEALDRRQDDPRHVVVFGPPCAGKTTLATILRSSAGYRGHFVADTDSLCIKAGLEQSTPDGVLSAVLDAADDLGFPAIVLVNGNGGEFLRLYEECEARATCVILLPSTEQLVRFSLDTDTRSRVYIDNSAAAEHTLWRAYADQHGLAVYHGPADFAAEVQING